MVPTDGIQILPMWRSNSHDYLYSSIFLLTTGDFSQRRSIWKIGTQGGWHMHSCDIKNCSNFFIDRNGKRCTSKTGTRFCHTFDERDLGATIGNVGRFVLACSLTQSKSLLCPLGMHVTKISPKYLHQQKPYRGPRCLHEPSLKMVPQITAKYAMTCRPR